MKKKNTLKKSTGCSKCSFKREVQRNTGLSQEKRKISNNLSTYQKEKAQNQQKKGNKDERGND